MGSECDVNLPGPVVDFKQKYLELLDTVNDLREKLDIQEEKHAENRAEDLHSLAESLKRISALEKITYNVGDDFKVLAKDEQRAIILKNYVDKNGAVSTKDARRILKVHSPESARRAMIFCKDNYVGFYLTKTRRGVSVLRYKMEVFK